MTRLDLRLIPGHPDHAGGLMFVGDSLRAFWLVSFALGAIVAGQVANRIMFHGESLATFKHIAIGLVVFVLILFAGPLTLFIGKLRETKRRGDFVYGALATEVGRQFEHDCLNRERGANEEAQNTQDFSLHSNIYGVVANVYGMKDFPFGLRGLGLLIAVTLMPFVPVALMVMPLKVIIKDFAKILSL
jgi:cytochrome c oxidase assembly factor CtaG